MENWRLELSVGQIFTRGKHRMSKNIQDNRANMKYSYHHERYGKVMKRNFRSKANADRYNFKRDSLSPVLFS